jgi:hypothetical protein
METAWKMATPFDATADGGTDTLRHNPALGRDLGLLLIAKGLNERDIVGKRRERLLRSARGHAEELRSLFDAGRTVEPAPYLQGAILYTDVHRDDLLDLNHVRGVHATEPFDVDYHGALMAIAVADHIIVADGSTASARSIHHPWFAQLHSVSFSDDGRKLLVTSGDFDSILEVDVASGSVDWKWTTWENGYPVGADGTYIARTRAEFEKAQAHGKAILFGDLDTTPFRKGIATGTQPCHVNSAIYSRRGSILTTLFHTGEVLEIDKRTLEKRVVVRNLKEPHEVQRTAEGYCVTDTRNGAWLNFDEDFRLQQRVSLHQVPGKDPEFGDLEWIQTISQLSGDIYGAVDCIRYQIILFDRRRLEYRAIPLNGSLILQSVHHARIPAAVEQLLRSYGKPTSASEFAAARP